MSLSELLKNLVKQGCFPCISFRGGISPWRAHVNSARNYWADASTPLRALKRATELWEKANKPMDDYAASPE